MPTQIGRYQVQAELGRGGFGRVYRAFDPTVSRLVAVKVLTEGGKDILTRFRNEATVAGNLRHENIVTVYEYGEYEGRPFLAMEYLEGDNLHQIISSKKPLSLLQKCNIMAQVAEGLYCAHRSGVVHRDVKPANIMVQGDGTVKIMDFGIARIIRDNEATRLTQQGYVLGTLLYMAPEQFAGSEIDALCDIFAYGVIYYELLTGRHPFEAPDSRALMYKISFEDPPPIGNLAPDVPEALQRVVNRILHKDRELRYQTLKEVQFDTDPIRIDLRQERAATLLIQGQQLYEKGQLEPAQAVVLEVLSLDPSNRVARSLWENLQKQLQQRTLQPRIEALLKAGEEQLALRRFIDAIQNFESALRLDRDNVYIQSRLEQARGLMEHSKRAALLLLEARKEFERQDLTSAYKSATEALRHDPQSADAAEFLRTVQAAIERRQQERRVEEAIAKVEGLLALRAYDEAIAVLHALGPEAESPRAARLLQWIRTEKEDYERKQRLQNDMAAATDLLREGRFREAVQCLEALQPEFPEHEELAQLHAYAQRELAAQERARAVEKIAADAASLAQANQFERSLALLDQALKQYPGESVLIRLLGSTMAAKADWDCQQAVQAALNKCAALRAAGRLPEAIQVAEEALREYNAEPRLLDALHGLEKDLEQQRRLQAIQTTRAEADKFIGQKQPDKAIQWIRQALVRYPDEPELTEALTRAQEEVRALERARAVDQISRDAAGRLAGNDFAAALDVLERGLKTYPGEPLLLERQKAALAAKAAWEREQLLQEITRRARRLGSDKQFVDAIALVEGVLQHYPEEQPLLQLKQQLETEWEEHERREAIRKAANDAKALLSAGRLEEAIRMLQDSLRIDPGEPELQALLTRAQEELRARERAAAIARLLAEARALAGRQDFDGGVRILEQALKQFPAEPQLVRELDAVGKAKAAWQRQQAIDDILRRVTQMRSEKRFNDAQQLLARSLKQYDNEPSLREAHQQIERQWQEHKRREAIAKAAADAAALLDRGQLDAAWQLLNDSVARYPKEPALDTLLARARQELDARRRAQAIAKVLSEARDMAEQLNFDAAIQALDRALQEWPGETSLLGLQKAVKADRANWEREQAIRKAVEAADQLARQHKYEDALRAVDQALQKYKGAQLLLDLRGRLERDWEEKKRSDAIAASVAEASSLLQQDKLDDAQNSLRDSLGRFPGEAALESLLAQVEQELQARRNREEAARAAASLIAAGHYEDAIEALRQALREAPSDPALSALLAQARAQLEARRKAEAIAGAAAEARALAEARNYDDALALLERSLKTWPGETDLLDLRQSIDAARSAWQREQALQDRLKLLERLLREKRFAQGLEVVDAALREFPGNDRLQQFQQDLRLREAARQAAELIAQGRPADALRLLQSLPASSGDAEIESLLDRARQAVRDQERQAAIRRISDEARALADAGKFNEALAMLDQGLANFPRETALLDVRRSALQAREAARRRQAIESAVRRAASLERENRLAEALATVENAIVEFGEESALVQVRQRLQAALLEQERRQNRLRDIEELRRLEAQARQTAGPARAAEILEEARAIAGHYPADPEVRTVVAPALEQLDSIAAVQRELAARNFSAALEICTRIEAKYPGHVAFGELKTEAERGRQLVFIEDLQRRVAAESSLETRVRLLEDALQRYPAERWAESELRTTRNKLALARSIAGKALAHEKAAQWDQALEQWNSLATIYKGYPDLDASLRRVQKKREELRAAAIAQWVEKVEAQIKAGDLSKASELLSRAGAEFPGTPALDNTSRRLEQLRQERIRIKELLARGQAECEKGRYPQGQATLLEAVRLDQTDPATRKLVWNSFVSYAQAAVKSDWRAAESLARAAADLDPKSPLPADLQAAIAERKKDEIVSECLGQAEQLRKSGDAPGALVEVERALLAYPDDPRLKRLRKSLAAQVNELRQAALAELQLMRQTAPAATDVAQLEPMRLRAAAIEQQHSADNELRVQVQETVRALTARIEALREAERAARAAVLRKRLLVGAASAVALLGGIFVARILFKPTELIPLSVSTSPEGAAVKAGTLTCSGPNCELELKPGTYSVEARLDGYRPAIQSVTVSAANHPPLRLVLEPLSPQVQIVTNFASGTVTLDGRRAGDLRNGQLTLTAVPFGRHQVSVSSPDGQGKVAFETAAGRLPAISGKVEARDADAVVVSNLGSNARLDCDCANDKVTLDGKPVGAMSASGLELHDLTEGNKNLQLGDRPLIVSVHPEPALSFFLTSNRNIGTLVVETNVENPTILINDQRYTGTAGPGLTRIPLNVAQYTVKLLKNGYTSPPPQTVQIQKGGTERLQFKLDPLNAVLRIRGALPGTQVAVDGKPVGQIRQDERLTVDIPTGQHSIELSKPGYAPKRIVRNFGAGETVGIEAAEAILNPDQNAVEEARRREDQAAWDAVNKNDRAALQQFIDQHPNSRLVADARNQIGRLDQAKADQQRQEQLRRDEEQRRAVQAAEQKKAAQAEEQRKNLADEQRRAALEAQRKNALDEEQRKKQEAAQSQQAARAERQSILDVLKSWTAAYDNRDANAVKAVFPGVPNFKELQNSFKIFRSIQVTLVPEDPKISGDAATVRCQRSALFTDDRGKKLPQQDSVTFGLRNVGGHWLITSMQ